MCHKLLNVSNYHRVNVIKRSLVIGDQRNTICAKIRGVRGRLANDSPDRPGTAAMVQPTRIMMAPRNHGTACDTVGGSKSKSPNEGARGFGFMVSSQVGVGGEIAPAQLCQLSQDYGGGTRTESTAATITPAARINTPAGDKFPDFQAALPEFLAVRPCPESTLDASKCGSTNPGTLAVHQGDRQKAGLAGHWEMPLKMLRLPKYPRPNQSSSGVGY